MNFVETKEWEKRRLKRKMEKWINGKWTETDQSGRDTNVEQLVLGSD